MCQSRRIQTGPVLDKSERPQRADDFPKLEFVNAVTL
jgi:hypothetical protein